MRIRSTVTALLATAGMIASPAALASSSPKVKIGSACKKSQVGKTTKSGKSTLVCKRVAQHYKWELKK